MRFLPFFPMLWQYLLTTTLDMITYRTMKKGMNTITRKEDKIPFDLEYFNKITKGGLPNKTLNVALAGTGVGKSLFMCHVASSVLLQGRNVLYITMEMAEEKIAERIDANLLNVPIQDLGRFAKKTFENKVNQHL
jgi:predicted ATP-dependent serine protease